MHCFAAKRLLLVYVIFGSLWSLAAAETLTVTAPQAKMYAHPDTKSRVLVSVPRGTIVSLLEHRAGWYQITLADGNTGWVAEPLVTRAPEVAPAHGFEVVSIRDRQGQPVALYRASYALLIGASGYADWTRLPGVVQDITAVKAVLESQGFRSSRYTIRHSRLAARLRHLHQHAWSGGRGSLVDLLRRAWAHIETQVWRGYGVHCPR